MAVPPRTNLGRCDRREIGNVVWLELGLSGYRRRPLTTQWSEFDRTPENTKTLIPGTSRTAPLRTGDTDLQTFFLPVWVGYPNARSLKSASACSTADKSASWRGPTR